MCRWKFSHHRTLRLIYQGIFHILLSIICSIRLHFDTWKILPATLVHFLNSLPSISFTFRSVTSCILCFTAWIQIHKRCCKQDSGSNNVNFYQRKWFIDKMIWQIKDSYMITAEIWSSRQPLGFFLNDFFWQLKKPT